MTLTSAAEPAVHPTRSSRLARLVDSPRITGLDIARALAVLGMVGAHVASIPTFSLSDPLSYLSIAHGNSSILFALLAGISIALLTGRSRIPEPEQLPRLRLMIAGRASMIFLIGVLLELTGTSVVVILPFFGALFLTAIPFLRWRPRHLLLLAVIVAILAPATVQLLLQLALLPGGSGIEFLLTGVYRLTTWLPLVLAGMAIGRTDLTSQRVAARITAAGTAFLVGASALALTLPGVLAPVVGVLGIEPQMLPEPQVGVIQLGTPGDKKTTSDPASGLPAHPEPDGALAEDGAPDPSADDDGPVPSEQIDFTGMHCQPPAPGDTTVVCWSGEATEGDGTVPDGSQGPGADGIAPDGPSGMAGDGGKTVGGPSASSHPEGSTPSSVSDPEATGAEGWASYPERLLSGRPASDVLNGFLQSGPHSGGSLETLGSGGLAAMVVGLCLLLTNRLRTLRRALAPLAALGSMPLTAYAGHILLILALTGPSGGLHSMGAWLWMGLGLIGFSTVWALWRGRGPLETLAAWSAQSMAGAPAEAAPSTAPSTTVHARSSTDTSIPA